MRHACAVCYAASVLIRVGSQGAQVRNNCVVRQGLLDELEVCLLAMGLPIAPPEPELVLLPASGPGVSGGGGLGLHRAKLQLKAEPRARAAAISGRRRRRDDDDADFEASAGEKELLEEDEGLEQGLGTLAGGALREEEGESCLDASKGKAKASKKPSVKSRLMKKLRIK